MLRLHNQVWDILPEYIHQVLEEMKVEETDKKRKLRKLHHYQVFNR